MSPIAVRQWMTRSRRTRPADVRADAAVLLVHGMGAQQSRETLFEWADPLVRRLEHRLAGSHSSTSIDAPAPLRMLDYSVTETGESSLLAEIDRGAPATPFRILMRESRWSESFLPLSRREVFNWAARFLWKAIVRALTYISGIIGTRLTRPTGTARPVRFIVQAIVAVGWLAIVPALWVVAVAVASVLTVLLAFSSVLLVIPPIRDAAASIVLALVEAIGDPAVLVSRPARAGAMRHHVADSLRSLRAEAGDGVPITVIAHSQGAAIATEVLFAVGGETNAAGLTRRALAPRREPEGIPIDTLITVGAGVSLLGAGYDHGGPLRGRPVESWRRSSMARRWINIWATWDPISAGAIADTDVARTRITRDARIGVLEHPSGDERLIEEHQVRTTVSPLTDHQSYPSNIPEVIDPIIDAVLESTGRSLILRASDAELTRLRWVRLVRTHGLNRLVIGATGTAVAFTSAITSSTFVTRLVNFVSTSIVDLRALLDTPLLSWAAPWLSNGIVLIVVTVALLWVSTRLRAAVERRLIWSIPGWKTSLLSALHLPFTIAIGFAAAATAAFAMYPLLRSESMAPTVAVGLGVLLVWATALALALDVPRVRSSPAPASRRLIS